MTMCADDEAYSNREQKPFNKQAAELIDTALDLIKKVLVKHSAAVLEEMHDQIVKRNERIAELEREQDALLRECFTAIEDYDRLLISKRNEILDKIIKTYAHASDCGLHNGPAYPPGSCDCGVLAKLRAATAKSAGE